MSGQMKKAPKTLWFQCFLLMVEMIGIEPTTF